MKDYYVVGKPFPRIDGKAKATGEAKFTVDLTLPGMLHAKILRSAYPHARILNIHTDKAKKLMGVKAVITGKDTAGIRLDGTLSGMKDKDLLATDKVRYIGDEIAVVAAMDLDTAEEVLELIEVEYEQLPAVFDIEEAMQEGAPRIHDRVERNIARQISMNFGNVDKGFQESDYVRKDRFVIGAPSNCWMETEICLASYDSSEKLTLWTPTQSPHIICKEIAATMGMRDGKVRVICPHIGGAFGGRVGSRPHHHIAAFLAKKTGRPIRLELTREEIFNAGQGMIIDLETGVKRDGTLVARNLRILFDSGGYIGTGLINTIISGLMPNLPYMLPNIKYEGTLVYTNNPVRGIQPGGGIVPVNYAVGTQMDMIAEELRIDPIEICVRNAVQPGYITANKFKIGSCGLTECIRKASKEADWDGRRNKLGGSRGLGIGCGSVSSGAKGFFAHDASAAMVKLQEDGSITLLTGLPDMGQGTLTGLSQIVAEELGVALEDIMVTSADTEITPFDLGAYGQRGIFITGNAVKAAAADAKRQLLDVAAEKLDANPEDLEIRERRIYMKRAPEKRMSFSEAVSASLNSEKGEPIMGKGYYNPSSYMDSHTYEGNMALAYSFGAQVAEVQVDPETKQIRLIKMSAAHDVGFAINPMAVESQIEGQVWSGTEVTLFHERLLEQGQILNPSFLNYRFSTAMEMPRIKTIIVESKDPYGPFGAKEVGEGPITAVSAAIGNAIYDAIGVRIKELPVTPERLFEAMEKRESLKP